jgi:hypothetical protein
LSDRQSGCTKTGGDEDHQFAVPVGRGAGPERVTDDRQVAEEGQCRIPLCGMVRCIVHQPADDYGLTVPHCNLRLDPAHQQTRITRGIDISGKLEIRIADMRSTRRGCIKGNQRAGDILDLGPNVHVNGPVLSIQLRGHDKLQAGLPGGGQLSLPQNPGCATEKRVQVPQVGNLQQLDPFFFLKQVEKSG